MVREGINMRKRAQVLKGNEYSGTSYPRIALPFSSG